MAIREGSNLAFRKTKTRPIGAKVPGIRLMLRKQNGCKTTGEQGKKYELVKCIFIIDRIYKSNEGFYCLNNNSLSGGSDWHC
ncbi:MAG: hypothetical protein IPJ31_15370 [Bacteroidetes bacterium]|nr:hypothetical protein [Bacteroidota bacterium]